ncbi:protein ALP1-like [Ischnura elegans]|uniref:protein ALP1-like n=1 Tax=Ischnura elegans TaxID=197161 RepID=UPI001ED88CF8|nr:protein ALP1-like [Ischnura elegans]XP_046400425.1 protein ALP1-like [Ischnura elegans]
MSDSKYLLLLLLLKKRRQRQRKMHIHPILCARESKGLYYTLFDELCADNTKFFNYFRMSKSSFFELLGLIKDEITGADTTMRRCITPEEKLVVTLRYFATGTSMQDLHYQYRISQPSISMIIRQVCAAIWKNLQHLCFPELTTDFWLKTAAKFYEQTNFPHCIGALDGKQIRVIKPVNSGSLYYNYKNYFSILLLAMCDADYKFIFVDVGAYGKSSDSTVFKESTFKKKLDSGLLNIPENASSFQGFEEPMPFVIVGDEGFGLTTKLLRPYSGKCLDVKKRIFNYRLSRARRNIECSFGILANKWRIFHRPLNVEISLCESIIKVCCLLHNFVRERDGFKVEDTILSVDNLYDWSDNIQPPTKTAIQIRDKFCDYFVSEAGAVSWQMEKI